MKVYFDGAKNYLQQALAIQEKKLGNMHLQRFAELLTHQNKVPQRRSQTARETLETRYLLVSAHLERAKLELGESKKHELEQAKEMLDIRQNSLPNKKPIFLDAEINHELGMAHLELGANEKAVEHFELAYNQDKKLEYALPLIETYEKLQQYEKAEPLLRFVHEASVKKFGLAHPNTIDYLGRLVKFQIDQNKPQTAIKLCNDAVFEREKEFGFKHAETLRCLEHGATLFSAERKLRSALKKPGPPKKQDKWVTFADPVVTNPSQIASEHAIQLWNDAVIRREKMLGFEEDITTCLLNDAVKFFSDQGMPECATEILQKAHDRRRKQLPNFGPEHPAAKRLEDLERLITFSALPFRDDDLLANHENKLPSRSLIENMERAVMSLVVERGNPGFATKIVKDALEKRKNHSDYRPDDPSIKSLEDLTKRVEALENFSQLPFFRDAHPLTSHNSDHVSTGSQIPSTDLSSQMQEVNSKQVAHNMSDTPEDLTHDQKPTPQTSQEVFVSGESTTVPTPDEPAKRKRKNNNLITKLSKLIYKSIAFKNSKKSS